MGGSWKSAAEHLASVAAGGLREGDAAIDVGGTDRKSDVVLGPGLEWAGIGQTACDLIIGDRRPAVGDRRVEEQAQRTRGIGLRWAYHLLQEIHVGAVTPAALQQRLSAEDGRVAVDVGQHGVAVGLAHPSSAGMRRPVDPE